MHPAFSVLFFTVTSGFGYGLLFFLLLSRLGHWVVVDDQTFLIACGVAFVLFTLGLLSSTQHLANPKNAWRSFVRFRTSWLSREAVLALLGYPLFAATIFVIWQQWSSGIVTGLILLSLIWIGLLVFSTAMIYASLKTIPQWHSPLVPLAFVVFSLISGLLCFGVVVDWEPTGLVNLSLLLLLSGALIKAFYYRMVGRPTRSSINTATSFSQAQVTLFDAGHSSKNFSQREFIYEVGPKTTSVARVLVFLFVFVLPAVLLLVWGGGWAGISAVVSIYLGLLLERWLFFVEAKHVIRHYYGAS